MSRGVVAELKSWGRWMLSYAMAQEWGTTISGDEETALEISENNGYYTTLVDEIKRCSNA